MNQTSHPLTFSRCATALAAALALALLAPHVLADAALTGPVAEQRLVGPLWGYEQAQRTPDPAVRFGRLPNGLLYALQHNETPKDGVAMRMRIGSGSLQERDEERGLAHFLEHMAFRGSANVPDGEVVRMLQRQGLRFGADTNASTGLDQTVYHFNFPKADAAALDTGLRLFREIGDRLTLDPQLVEQEKGVILSEERVRDGPSLRAWVAQMRQHLEGTRVTQRLPIGRIETIQAATAERLRRYYTANYRPDNATLIVVGNIDVDAVERQIRERFADWRNATPPDEPDLGAPRPTRPAVEYVVENAPSLLTLTWLQPVDVRPHTLAVSREFLVQGLALTVLNQRLSDRALQPGSPLMGASANVQSSVYKVAGTAQLAVQAQPGRWADALDAVVAELRQLLVHGVTPADMQRVVPGVRSQTQARLAQDPTRPHAAIADRLLHAVHPNGPHIGAQQAMDDVELLLPAIQADELTAALWRKFGDPQPLVFRSTKSGAVGVEALARQVAQAMERPVAVQAAAATADWPYTDFGPPSAIVARTQDAELGTTNVHFGNGTRLVIKSTPLQKDRVEVRVHLGQGRAGIAARHQHAIWALGSLTLGGTGQRSMAEIRQWRQSSGKRIDVSFSAGQHAFTLSGTTRPADLLAQLQLLAAHARDPGFRPEFGEKLAALGGQMVGSLQARPAAVHEREVSRVMNGGDARLGKPPSTFDVAATRADELPAILKPALASAPDIFIVGDVSEDAAIAAVQATFGAGDERPRQPRVALKAEPVTGGGAPHVVYHRGRADQAVLGWYWSMPDHWTDPALSTTGRVAGALLRARLVDTVREKLGITYSPQAGAGGSLDLPGSGRLFVNIETPPEKFDAVRELLRTQLRELAEQPVSADELDRARRPQVESALKEPESAAYWLLWLSRIQAEPRMKDQMQAEVGSLRAVTAEAVQAYFRDHIAPRPPIEVVARAPEAAAAK